MHTSSFQFDNFKIKKSSIEILSPGDDNLSINFEMSGHIQKENGIYNLTLITDINNESDTIKINVECVGRFNFDKGTEIDRDNISSLFYINAPAILFPYVRAYVSTLTNLSGIKPITLPTLNLIELGKTLKEKTVIE